MHFEQTKQNNNWYVCILILITQIQMGLYIYADVYIQLTNSLKNDAFEYKNNCYVDLRSADSEG